MASDVEANRRGKNNNIGLMRHGLSSGAANLPITEGEVLIESEFLELSSHLHYSKTVHILLTDEFVFVKEMRDRRDSEAHVLQYESGKTVSKFRRSEISVKVCEGCPFTFKARWNKETSLWKTYELCGKEEVWPKWLRSFNVEEPPGQRMIPSHSICEIECDSDSDDSDDDDGEDVQIPECSFPLSVDRTISMWSMSMLNPSNVRRLAITQHHRPSVARLSRLVSSGSSDDAQDVLNAGSLYRSNSHPRVSLVKPFRCSSLPHVGDLENVRVDSDLKNHGCRTRGETSADNSNHVLSSEALRERVVDTPNTTLATLQQRVENLRAHPSNLNFVRRGKGDDPPWDSLAMPRHRRKHSLDVALTNEANRIPMPSDSSIRLGARTPLFYHKQEQADENKMTSTVHKTNTPETSLSPKKINKRLGKRSESLPSSRRPDLSHVTHPVSERGSKEGIARQLDFKDDMAVDLSDSNQGPRKDKIKRFWTILYKKRPKLRVPTAQSADSVKTDNDSRSADRSSFSVLDSDTPNGVKIIGNRRGGLSNSLSISNDKISGFISILDPHRTVQTQMQSKQEFSEGDSTPIGRPSLSYSGSMRKKKLVKKILSPIFKSSSLEEDMSNQATSPTGEVPQSPDMVDSYVPDLSQRLIDIDASLFAREITLIDKELFIRIPWPELANCGWMTKDKYVTSPNVMAMVEFFNRVALLAASEILSQDTPSGRARAISKIIQIADKCHLLGNFNSLKALLAGLQSTPVYRLKETWKEVPSKRKKKFRDLSILMGESNNFSLYRSELSACLENGPCLPFLGNFLTEIAQTHTYLACKRKKLNKGGKQSPLIGRSDKLDRPDGAVMNGETPKRNGMTENGVTPDWQPSPRDKENVTHEKSERQAAKVKRTPSRSKLWRFHNRQSINDSGVMLNRSRNSSTEVLDIPDGDLRKVLTSSSDSVITSSSSLNESPRNATSGNSRTPSKPPLLRRLSETSTNHNGISFLAKPRRRLSESKSSESRRSFLKGLVRRTPSSQSVKEGRVSRGSSSEKLTVSLSTLSVTENLNNLRFKDLAKSQSSPSVKEGGRLSPELSPGPPDRSPDIQVNHSSSNNSFVEDTPNTSCQALQSGTERQLWAYQIASSNPKAIFHQEGICKSFLEIMEGYRTTREKHLTNVHHGKPGFSSAAPVFDPKQFKANKEVMISKEVKQLLSSRSEERTSDQLQTVLYALQTLESFSELPLHMQQDVCKVAWLQSLPANKIIIKQDHVAESFYFLINGTVTVLSENDPTKDSPFTSLATLKRGSSFGETAIVNNCRRTASVVSKDPVQLLVIGKEDYQRIFMGQTKTGEEPAHLKFCRSLDFLADWPVDLLLAHPENCLFNYFRRGTVIVKDSNKSDWLYIIVSGVCQVLLRLEITKPRLSGKLPNRRELTTADKLAHLTEDRHRKTSYSASKLRRLPTRRSITQLTTGSYPTDKKRTKSLPPVFPITEVPSNSHLQPRKQTAFVQLGLLHPRSVFGLSTLLKFDDDFQLLQQASVSLVSRGAECVMISKKFFINQASELTKKWIRHNVRSYPSRETLQRNLQEKINWDAYKQDVIQNVIAR